MSMYGSVKAATIVTGNETSAAIDLGRDYDYLSVQLPATEAACKLYLKVAEAIGGTYYDLGKETTTDEETFGRADVWRLGGWRFVKVATTETQTSDWLIRIFGMRY